MLIQVLTRYSFIAKFTCFWIQLTVIPTMLAKIFSDENFFTKFAGLWSVWASSIDVFHHFSPLNLLFAVNARFHYKDAFFEVSRNSTSIVFKLAQDEATALSDFPLTQILMVFQIVNLDNIRAPLLYIWTPYFEFI